MPDSGCFRGFDTGECGDILNNQFYFAYGSNMWTDQMNRRCPQSIKVGTGVLHDYRWIISTRGYANIIDSPADEVHGVVYAISINDELSLDAFEGVAAGSYGKQVVRVLLEKQVVSCMVYIDPVTSEGIAHDEYIGRINNGITDAGLPDEYVAGSIRKFIPL
jgi:gamma-glutamylcyclotransferase (GGCT)/AIG2-like uncharacterized protein YtfP